MCLLRPALRVACSCLRVLRRAGTTPTQTPSTVTTMPTEQSCIGVEQLAQATHLGCAWSRTASILDTSGADGVEVRLPRLEVVFPASGVPLAAACAMKGRVGTDTLRL